MGLHRQEWALASSVCTGPASAFSPLSLSPALWLKADAGTVQTVSGSAAAADGDPVGQWLDQSGNGNHVSQATSTKRPTLKLAVQNGLPVLRADGVDDILSLAGGVALGTGQAFTAFVVFKPAALSSTYQVAFADGDTAADGFAALVDNSNKREFYTPALPSVDGNAAANYELWTLQWDGVTRQMWVDRNAVSLTNSAATVTAPTILTLFNDGSGSALSGDLGEAILYSNALSTANRQAAENYLRTRWGTA